MDELLEQVSPPITQPKMNKIIDMLEDPTLIAKYEELRHMKETLEKEYEEVGQFNESCMKEINALFKDCNISKTKVIIQIKYIFPKKAKIPSYLEADNWIQISNSGLGYSGTSLGNIRKMDKLKDVSDENWTFYEAFLRNTKVLAAIKKHIKPHCAQILDDMKKVLDKYPDLKEPQEFYISKELPNPNKTYKEYCNEKSKKLYFSMDPQDGFVINIGHKDGQWYGDSQFEIKLLSDENDYEDIEKPEYIYELLFIDKYYEIFKEAYQETSEKQRKVNGDWAGFKKELYSELGQYLVFNKINADDNIGEDDK